MTRHVELAEDGMHKEFFPRSPRGLHLGNLHPMATRDDVAIEIEGIGYRACKFFWPKRDSSTPEDQEHTGYCFVYFKDKHMAKRAKWTIRDPGLTLRGRPVTANDTRYIVSFSDKALESVDVSCSDQSRL